MVEEVRGSCLGSVGRNGAVKKAMTRGKQIYCSKRRGLGKHLNRRKHTHPARPQERLRLQAPLRRVTRTTGGTHQRDPQPQPSSGSGADPPAAQAQILNPRIDTEELEGKFIALDIPAEDVDGAQFNIAMQVQRQRAWGARSAYYLASLLAEQLKTGKSYEALRPVVGSICWTSMTSRTKVDKCSTCKWLNSDDHPLRLPAL